MELFTTSRASVFNRCKREHYNAYVLRKRPLEKAPALRMGSLVHDGIERWRLALQEGLSEPEALCVGLAAVDLSFTSEGSQAGSGFDLALATELVRGYHYRWFEHDRQNLEFLEVESEFQTALRNPDTGRPSKKFRLAGKVDAIARTRDGIALVETKTTSVDISTGSRYWEKLAMDGQVSTYFIGAAVLGYHVEHCIYDVVKKPGTRVRKATGPDKMRFKKDGTLYANCRTDDETPSEYQARVRKLIAADPQSHYVRGTVVRMADEIKEYQEDVWLTAESMYLHAKRKSHPRNHSACERYGSLCPYWLACKGDADINDPHRFRDSPSHMELKQEVTKGKK